MDLSSAILPLIENTEHKSLVIIGGHDHASALPLAGQFRQIRVASETLKSEPFDQGNLSAYHLPFREVLDELHRYDVIAFERSFHLLPDLMQIETFERLGRYQELLVIEDDMMGTLLYFSQAFTDDRAQIVQSRALISRFLHEGRIELEMALKGRHSEVFSARQELLDYFRCTLPEHYPFGEREFLRRTGGAQYPMELWAGFDVFKLRPYGWR